MVAGVGLWMCLIVYVLRCWVVCLGSFVNSVVYLVIVVDSLFGLMCFVVVG